MRRTPATIWWSLILGLVAPACGWGAETEGVFEEAVAPFLARYCQGCHGGEEPEADLALDRYQSIEDIVQDRDRWDTVLEMLRTRQMPPEGESRPEEAAYERMIRLVETELASIDCSQSSWPGSVTLRRLNRAEYNNTVRDLLGVTLRPADEFPSDDVGYGFDNIGDVLSMSPLLMEKYLAAAAAVVEQAFSDSALRDRLLVARPDEHRSAEEAARETLEHFATRAYRRPVREEELERLLQIVRLVREDGGDYEAQLMLAMQAVLASPHFVFRVEKDPEDPHGIRDLDGYELATRLSYFLWSSMPDEELMSLAADGRLLEDDVLRAQVERMLGDPKAHALVDNFAAQWLQLRDLDLAAPDPERFPEFDEELRQAMRHETELFFETVVREDRSILEFIDSDYTFVNERLARHYGLEGVEGDEFRRVELPPQRGGVLTHGSVLLLTSNPTRTSPVKRGKWILSNILGTPPLPPPENVPDLNEDEGAELLGSLRERMEQHRANPVCASCHSRMDPLGFGLENFNAVGSWRTEDGRFPIDSSGTLPGGVRFSGPTELLDYLRQQKAEEFGRCFAEKMLTYALGRGLESYDRCTVDAIVQTAADNGYRFSSIVLAIVTSDPFRKRGGTGGMP